MCYWCLLNLPASVRFNLCNIKLLALAKSEYLNNENILFTIKTSNDESYFHLFHVNFGKVLFKDFENKIIIIYIFLKTYH